MIFKVESNLVSCFYVPVPWDRATKES